MGWSGTAPPWSRRSAHPRGCRPPSCRRRPRAAAPPLPGRSRPGPRRPGRRRRPRAAAPRRRARTRTQARVASACLTMLARHSATAKYAADSTGGGSAGSVDGHRDRDRDRQRERLDRRRRARGRPAPAGGCRAPPSAGPPERDTVVSRASRSSAAAASGSVPISFSARPTFMPTEAIRAWAPSCRSRSIRRTSAALWSRVSRARRRRPPRPGARARSTRARAEDAALGQGPGADQRRGRPPPDEQQRAVEQRPAATTSQPPSTSAPTRCVTGATSSATGRHRQHEPAGRREPQEPEVPPAGLVAQPAERPGDHVVPAVSAYAAGIGSPSSVPLIRRCTAVSAAVAGTTPRASTKPTVISPRGMARIVRMRQGERRRHAAARSPATTAVSRSRSTRASPVDRRRADGSDRLQERGRAGHRRPVCHRDSADRGRHRRSTADRGAGRQQGQGDHRAATTTRRAARAGRRGRRPRRGRSRTGRSSPARRAARAPRRPPRRCRASASTEPLDLVRRGARAATAGAARPAGARPRRRTR